VRVEGTVRLQGPGSKRKGEPQCTIAPACQIQASELPVSMTTVMGCEVPKVMFVVTRESAP